MTSISSESRAMEVRHSLHQCGGKHTTYRRTSFGMPDFTGMQHRFCTTLGITSCCESDFVDGFTQR
jgi:hypothetical protein